LLLFFTSDFQRTLSFPATLPEVNS